MLSMGYPNLSIVPLENLDSFYLLF
jgi:hypothetical protein